MTLNMEQPALSILISKLSLTMQKLIVHFTFTARAQKTNGSNEGNSLVQKKEDMSFTERVLKVDECIRKNSTEAISFDDIKYFMDFSEKASDKINESGFSC